MKSIPFGTSGLSVPAIAVGCMRLNTLSKAAAAHYLHTALDLGMNFFDHADIYGGGECESLFAEALQMNDDLREKILLQSKCGIEQRDGRMLGYNFSKAYLLRAVDESLRRLRTDYLDVLVLHRPDALCEPEEVAEAFERLLSAGKVRHFGVSNQNPMQMALLQRYLRMPLVTDQLQLSITNCNMISAGINVNLENRAAADRDGSVLDYCRLHDITIQAWSPLQYGFFEGVFLGNEKFPVLNRKLEEIAGKYGVTSTTIAIAWILRHPAKIQPIAGTMNEDRLRQIAAAAEIRLTREEWYAIYMAAGNELP